MLNVEDFERDVKMNASGPFTNDLKDRVSQQALEVSRLAEEISEAQGIVDDVRRRCEALRLFRQKYHPGLHPIHRIPSEILSEIFMSCLTRENPSVLNHKSAPVVLTQVCRHWREDVFSNPGLWDCLHISFPSIKSSQFATAPGWLNLDPLLEKVIWWMELSRNRSVNVSIYQKPYITNIDAVSYTDFMKKLLPYAARWKRLEVLVSQRTLETFTSIHPDHVPRLEFFRLECHHATPPPLTNPAIFKAKKLHSISSRICSRFEEVLLINWSAITELSLEGHRKPLTDYSSPMSSMLTVKDALLILGRCPQLLRCRLFLSTQPGAYSENVTSHPLISLPRLEFLSVHEGNTHSDVLFNFLHAPLFTEFEFDTYNEKVPSPLYIFFSQFGARIKTLKIDCSTFAREDLHEYLLYIPALTELSMKSAPNTASILNPIEDAHEDARGKRALDDKDFEFLTPKKNGPIICPNLERFTYSAKMTIPDISPDAVLEFIDARRRVRQEGMKQLQYLSIPRRHWHSRLQKQLSPLLEEGFQIHFTLPGDEDIFSKSFSYMPCV